MFFMIVSIWLGIGFLGCLIALREQGYVTWRDLLCYVPLISLMGPIFFFYIVSESEWGKKKVWSRNHSEKITDFQKSKK